MWHTVKKQQEATAEAHQRSKCKLVSCCGPMCSERRIDSTPGPAELFRIVNTETARHLAEQPFPLPDLAAVLAESQEASAG